MAGDLALVITQPTAGIMIQVSLLTYLMFFIYNQLVIIDGNPLQSLVDSWLHCNDAKMQKASLDDVQKAQAYILVYTKILPTLVDPQAVDSKSENGLNRISSRSMIPKFADATKRLRIENLGFYSIKRTKTTIW